MQKTMKNKRGFVVAAMYPLKNVQFDVSAIYSLIKKYVSWLTIVYARKLSSIIPSAWEMS